MYGEATAKKVKSHLEDVDLPPQFVVTRWEAGSMQPYVMRNIYLKLKQLKKVLKRLVF